MPVVKAPQARSSRRRDATPAIDFLRRHEGATTLLPAAERLVRLRQDLHALMPGPLSSICDVSSFDDDDVHLRVFSASAAAKLRQTLPRLRDGLLQRGWKVNAIRVRVQPRISVEESRPWTSPQGTDMTGSGVAAFEALERELEPGESVLKTAVQRLLRRRRTLAGR